MEFLNSIEAYIIKEEKTIAQKNLVFRDLLLSTTNARPWMLVPPAKSFKTSSNPVVCDMPELLNKYTTTSTLVLSSVSRLR